VWCSLSMFCTRASSLLMGRPCKSCRCSAAMLLCSAASAAVPAGAFLTTCKSKWKLTHMYVVDEQASGAGCRDA
jgi:hypothetical protein